MGPAGKCPHSAWHVVPSCLSAPLPWEKDTRHSNVPIMTLPGLPLFLSPSGRQRLFLIMVTNQLMKVMALGLPLVGVGSSSGVMGLVGGGEKEGRQSPEAVAMGPLPHQDRGEALSPRPPHVGQVASTHEAASASPPSPCRAAPVQRALSPQGSVSVDTGVDGRALQDSRTLVWHVTLSPPAGLSLRQRPLHPAARALIRGTLSL